MKINRGVCLLAIGLAATVAWSAHAQLVKTGSLDGPANETYLLIGGGGSPIVDNATLNAALLDPNTSYGLGQGIWDPGAGNKYTSLVIEVAGSSGLNAFGIYDPLLLSNNREVFTGPDSPVLVKTITFTLNGGGTYDVTVAGGSTMTLTGPGFGFYFDPQGNSASRFYSQNSLNQYSAQQIVSWDINSTKFGFAPYPASNSGWLLGMEDQPYFTTDDDFNDMMVTFTALPVPEPTTLIAGALLLLPFGASTLRILRKSRVA